MRVMLTCYKSIRGTYFYKVVEKPSAMINKSFITTFRILIAFLFVNSPLYCFGIFWTFLYYIDGDTGSMTNIFLWKIKRYHTLWCAVMYCDSNKSCKISSKPNCESSHIFCAIFTNLFWRVKMQFIYRFDIVYYIIICISLEDAYTLSKGYPGLLTTWCVRFNPFKRVFWINLITIFKIIFCFFLFYHFRSELS